MKVWKDRLVMGLTVLAILLVASVPAMAQVGDGCIGVGDADDCIGVASSNQYTYQYDQYDEEGLDQYGDEFDDVTCYVTRDEDDEIDDIACFDDETGELVFED